MLILQNNPFIYIHLKNKILNQMEYYWKIFVIISFLSCNQPNIKQSLDTIDCVIDSQPDSN